MAGNYQQMIFINLPVASVEASVKFYSAITFVRNPAFSTADTAMMCLAPNQEGVGTINVSLLEHKFFQSFLPAGRGANDAQKSTQMINCLSAESRDHVDEMLEKAKAAGGEVGVLKLPSVNENIYFGSFADPDGHIWEVMWMNLQAIKPDSSP